MSAMRPNIAEMLPVGDIFIVGKRRDLDEKSVIALMESIQKIGIQTPITVRGDDDFPDPDTGDPMGAYVLVAGRHRLEACRRLGMNDIPCIVMDCDEIEAELWEIAENLHRADLTALQRDVQVARWIELNSNRVLAQVEPKPKGGRPEAGVRAASRNLGIEKEDARRAVKVASLSDEAKAVAKETGLDDNRSALLAAASEKEKGGDDVAFLRREHERREAEKTRKEAEKANRDTDRVIALTEAEQFAEWLFDRTANSELPKILSWIEGTKPRDVAAALRRRAA